MKTHLMIDIETLSTESNAIMISLGAVFFNEKEILERAEFYFAPEAWKGVSKPETIEFLLKNERAFAYYRRKIACSGSNTIEDICNFLKGRHFDRIWANTPAFDLVILKNQLKAAEHEPFWDYFQERDYRTIVKIFEDFGIEINLNFDGIKHTPLADAEAQAKKLMELNKKTKIIFYYDRAENTNKNNKISRVDRGVCGKKHINQPKWRAGYNCLL